MEGYPAEARSGPPGHALVAARWQTAAGGIDAAGRGVAATKAGSAPSRGGYPPPASAPHSALDFELHDAAIRANGPAATRSYYRCAQCAPIHLAQAEAGRWHSLAFSKLLYVEVDLRWICFPKPNFLGSVTVEV